MTPADPPLCVAPGCIARATWESDDGARCSLHDIARHLETSEDREEFAESYAAEARLERELEEEYR